MRKEVVSPESTFHVYFCTNIVFCTHIQASVREQTTRSASLEFLWSFRSLLALNRFISTKLSNDFEIQALKEQFSLKIFSNKILCEDFLIWFCLLVYLFLFVCFILVISHRAFPFQY